MAWVGMLAGGVASWMGAKESNKGSKNAGKVDVAHTVTQYPGSEFYRDAGAAAAYRQLFGEEPPLGAPGSRQTPKPGPLTGGGNRPGLGGGPGGGQVGEGDAGQYTPIASPSTAKGGKKGKGKGGGGTGAPKAPAFKGQSDTTKAAIDNSMRVAGDMENSATVKAAQDYTAGTLRGEDQNGYRAETADMLRGFGDSEAQSNYNRLLDELWDSDTGLGAGSGAATQRQDRGVNAATVARAYGGGGAYQPYAAAAYGGGGPQDPNDPGGRGMVGVEQNLESLLAGDDSPAMAKMRESIKRQGDEALAEQQRALRLRAAGSGMGGGTGQDYAEGTAMGRYGGYLADANARMYSDLYSQALGLGTQYDISAQDRISREKMNSENAAAASASSGNALAAAQAEMSSRERMQRLGLLADVTGMGLDTEKFRASGMGSLGEGFSGDQRNALSLAGDTNGLGQAGWLNAGGLSLGSDQTQTSWQNSQNSLRGQLAGVGVQRAALDFDKYRYNREAPMRDVSWYTDIIGGTYNPLLGYRDQGFDGRSQSPSYSNPWGQAIAGGAAGWQLGSQIQNSYQGGR